MGIIGQPPSSIEVWDAVTTCFFVDTAPVVIELASYKPCIHTVHEEYNCSIHYQICGGNIQNAETWRHLDQLGTPALSLGSR